MPAHDNRRSYDNRACNVSSATAHSSQTSDRTHAQIRMYANITDTNIHAEEENLVEEEETEGWREEQEKEDDEAVEEDEEEMLPTLACNGNSCTPVGGRGCECRTNMTGEPDYQGWVGWLTETTNHV